MRLERLQLPALLAAALACCWLPGKAKADYAGVTHIRWAFAYCESAGNIHAIGWRGVYRGKWQFDQQTWNAFAPRPWRGRDPAWVPEWVQDMVAERVTYDAWPNC